MRFGKISNNTAQSSLEYAVVIASIIAALLAMQVYIRRSFMGHFRGAADELGQQYDPKNTSGTHNYSYWAESVTGMYTLNETDLGYNLTTGLNCSEGGTYCSPDVFGTESFTVLNNSSQTEELNEKFTP
ncbi:MAG: hypothetical protein ABSB18_07850 [Candidatus Omnitrophota bacterium]